MYKLMILGPVKWRFESRAMIETRSFGHHRCSVKRKTSKKDSVFWQRQSPAKSHFLVLQSLFPPILHKTVHPSSHVMLLRYMSPSHRLVALAHTPCSHRIGLYGCRPFSKATSSSSTPNLPFPMVLSCLVVD